MMITQPKAMLTTCENKNEMQGKHKEVGNISANTCTVNERTFLLQQVVPSVDLVCCYISKSNVGAA